VSPPSAKDLSPIPKAPKAQCASLGCDLIRCSNSHPDLTPGTTDAQIEPGPQKRVDWIVRGLAESVPRHNRWWANLSTGPT